MSLTTNRFCQLFLVYHLMKVGSGRLGAYAPSPPRTEHTTFTVHPLSNCVRHPPEIFPGLRSSVMNSRRTRVVYPCTAAIIQGRRSFLTGYFSGQTPCGGYSRPPCLPDAGIHVCARPLVFRSSLTIRLCSRHPLPLVKRATQRY